MMRRYLRYACVALNVIGILLGLLLVFGVFFESGVAGLCEAWVTRKPVTPEDVSGVIQLAVTIGLVLLVLHSVNIYLLVKRPDKKLLRIVWGNLNIAPLWIRFLVLMSELCEPGSSGAPSGIITNILVTAAYGMSVYFIFREKGADDKPILSVSMKDEARTRRYLRYACIAANVIFALLGIATLHVALFDTSTAEFAASFDPYGTKTPEVINHAIKITAIVLTILTLIHWVNANLLIIRPKSNLLRVLWGNLNILPLIFCLLVVMFEFYKNGSLGNSPGLLWLIPFSIYILSVYFLFKEEYREGEAIRA